MAIYKENIVDIDLESGKIFRSFLNHSIGQKDSDADRFGVRVFRGKEPVDLTGSNCQAIFMGPVGDPIALTSHGTVSENVAYVTLPQACYNYDGQFCLAIKLVNSTDGVTNTVRIVDGIVDKTGAAGAVAPTETVPTYQEILAVYSDMQECLEDFDDYKDGIDAEVDALKSAIFSIMFADATAIVGTEDNHADLDDYTTPGNYCVTSSTLARYVDHAPVTDSAYRLWVFQTTATSRICQLAVTNSSGSTRIHIRHKLSSGWSEWQGLAAREYVDTKMGTVPSGKTLQGQIDTIDGKLGSDVLPTTAQTITGAIAEHETDIGNLKNGFDNTNLNLVGNKDTVYSCYIPKNATITISRKTASSLNDTKFRLHLFSEDMVELYNPYLQKTDMSRTMTLELTGDAYYVSYEIKEGSDDQLQLEIGSEATGYKPFVGTVPYLYDVLKNGSSSTGHVEHIRVMTHNIGHYGGGEGTGGYYGNDVDTQIQNWRNMYNATKPDILVMQEWYPYFDHANTHSCFTYLYDPLFKYNVSESFSNVDGRAICSKYNLYDKSTFSVSGTYIDGEGVTQTDVRNMLAAKTIINGREILIVSAHLKNGAGEQAASCRLEQADELIPKINAIGCSNILLCGDFNAYVGSPAGPDTALLAKFTTAGYTLLNCGYFGEIYTYPNSRPLDNIMLKGDFSLSGAESNAGWICTSDHYPLVGDITIG